MPKSRLDRHLYVLGDPSAHVGFLNCERIAQRSHIHGWSVETHYHEGLCQLFVFNKGHVKGQVDYDTHLITGPAVVWVPALCLHGFEYQVDMEGWVITVPSADVARIVTRAPWFKRWIAMPQLLTGSGHHSDLLNTVDIARKIEDEHQTIDADRNLALEAWYLHLLIQLDRGLSPEIAPQSGVTDRKRHLVARFQELLEQYQFSGQSVSAYATQLSVTPTHLSRSVKTVTGRTAGQIIADHSLLNAKRKLAFTDQSISEMAYELGFSSPSYFTRFFSAQTRETPRSFRKRLRKHSD